MYKIKKFIRKKNRLKYGELEEHTENLNYKKKVGKFPTKSGDYIIKINKSKFIGHYDDKKKTFEGRIIQNGVVVFEGTLLCWELYKGSVDNLHNNYFGEDYGIYNGEYNYGEFYGTITDNKSYIAKGKFSKKHSIIEGVIYDNNNIYVGKWNRDGKLYCKDGLKIYNCKLDNMNNAVEDYEKYKKTHAYDEGVFKNGRLTYGTFVSVDRIVFEGYFKDDKLIRGKVIKNGKIIYEGDYMDNYPYTGVAYGYMFKGHKYIGEFEEGVFNGVKEDNKDQWTKEGVFFKNGHLKEGTLMHNDGTIMKGTFGTRGQLLKGDYECNGVKYTGKYKDDMLKNGRAEFSTGQIFEGIFNKKGEIISGTYYDPEEKYSYVGTFFNNQLIEGEILKDDKVVYKGTFYNMKMYKGTADGYINFNKKIEYYGDVIDGQFYGKLIRNKDIIYEGVFYDNVLIKEGRRTDGEGNILDGRFSKSGKLLEGMFVCKETNMKYIGKLNQKNYVYRWKFIEEGILYFPSDGFESAIDFLTSIKGKNLEISYHCGKEYCIQIICENSKTKDKNKNFTVDTIVYYENKDLTDEITKDLTNDLTDNIEYEIDCDVNIEDIIKLHNNDRKTFGILKDLHVYVPRLPIDIVNCILLRDVELDAFYDVETHRDYLKDLGCTNMHLKQLEQFANNREIYVSNEEIADSIGFVVNEKVDN